MISFKDVYKTYFSNIDKARRKALRDIFFRPSSLTSLGNEKSLAVRNISFSLEKGQLLWIIGSQKSGKTTIAKLICGLLYPNYGTVGVNGSARLVSLRGISATPFTNFKNYIYLLAMSYGADSENLKKLYGDIVQEATFKELEGESINQIPKQIMQKLNYYISLFVDSDIYVFDENYYYDNSKYCNETCRKRINEIINNKTVVVLSANNNKYSLNPDKVVILNNGQIEFDGSYENAEKILSRAGQAEVSQPTSIDTDKATGNSSNDSVNTELAAEIVDIFLTDKDGNEIKTGIDQKGRSRIYSDQDININVVFNSLLEDIDISVGVDIYSGGVLAFGSRQPITRLYEKKKYRARINIPANLLADRVYSVNASISVYREYGRSVIKMHNALKFSAMTPSIEIDSPYAIPIMNPGIVHPFLSWNISTEQ